MNSGTDRGRKCRSNDHHIGYAHDRGNRSDIAHEIEMELLVERGVDRVRRRHQQDGIPVGCRIHHRLGADVGCTHLAGSRSRRVGRAAPTSQGPSTRAMMSFGPAGAKGTTIRTGRDGYGSACAMTRDGRQHGGARGQMQEPAAEKFHGDPLVSSSSRASASGGRWIPGPWRGHVAAEATASSEGTWSLPEDFLEIRRKAASRRDGSESAI